MLVIVAVLVLTSRTVSSQEVNLGENPILFYSLTCPHCKNVEGFLTKNEVRKTIKFAELEVSQDQKNVRKYEKAVEVCQASQEKIGSVPLLFAEGRCYFGDVDVINFFKEALKTKK